MFIFPTSLAVYLTIEIYNCDISLGYPGIGRVYEQTVSMKVDRFIINQMFPKSNGFHVLCGKSLTSVSTVSSILKAEDTMQCFKSILI